MKEKTILIVDDDPHIISALTRELHDEPYTVIGAESAEAGLRLLERQPVQLAISDEKMPGMSGTEFFLTLRGRYPETIRVMLTGKADVASAMKAVNEGEIYRFFTKPWDPVDLTLSIRHGLEKFDYEEERRLLLRTVMIQRNELDSLEKQFPGISSVFRERDDAILFQSMPPEEIEEIKEWCRRENSRKETT